jgi:uncharacterized protein (DUF1778 family)
MIIVIMPKRTESVQVYMTEEEKRALRVAAAKRDSNMAQYCRNAVFSQLEADGEHPRDD